MTDSPDYTLIAELDPPGSGAWEGAARDIKTGLWYLAHNLGTGEGRIYQFKDTGDIAKPYESTMKLVNLTHVYGFGVHDGVLWLGWDGSDGNDIVNIPFEAGKTATKADAKKLHVFTEYPTQMAFSPTRAGIVLCQTIGNYYRFTKRLTDDILKNKNRPIGISITVKKPSDTWLQGFSLAGTYIYVALGKPGERSWIDKYSVKTGKKIGTLNVTGSGFLPIEMKSAKTVEEADAELEGMDGRTFSRKVFHDEERKLRVYQLNKF